MNATFIVHSDDEEQRDVVSPETVLPKSPKEGREMAKAKKDRAQSRKISKRKTNLRSEQSQRVAATSEDERETTSDGSLDEQSGKVSNRKKRPRPEGPLNPCTSQCRRKCFSKFDQVEREKIFKDFASLNARSKNLFWAHYMRKDVTPKPGKRKKVEENPTTRGWYTYSLPKDDGSMDVCRKMFAATLGYNENSLNAALRAHKSVVNGEVTKKTQGQYQRDRQKEQAVKKDILSYNPQV